MIRNDKKYALRSPNILMEVRNCVVGEDGHGQEVNLSDFYYALQQVHADGGRVERTVENVQHAVRNLVEIRKDPKSASTITMRKVALGAVLADALSLPVANNVNLYGVGPYRILLKKWCKSVLPTLTDAEKKQTFCMAVNSAVGRQLKQPLVIAELSSPSELLETLIPAIDKKYAKKADKLKAFTDEIYRMMPALPRDEATLRDYTPAVEAIDRAIKEAIAKAYAEQIGHWRIG